MQAAGDNTVAIVAIAVGGGVTLAGAVIAAVAAQLRLRTQLQHDRAIRDIAELRTIIDEALDISDKLLNTARDGRGGDLGAVSRLDDVLDEAHSIANKFRTRTASHEPMTRRWFELIATMEPMMEILDSDAFTTCELTTDDQRWKPFDDASERFMPAWHLFVDEARKLLAIERFRD